MGSRGPNAELRNETASIRLAVCVGLLGRLRVGISPRMESRDERLRSGERPGLEGQGLPQGDNGRNVDGAPHRLPCRVRESRIFSAQLAAPALCCWSADYLFGG